jgi:hypothetical protein
MTTIMNTRDLDIRALASGLSPRSPIGPARVLFTNPRSTTSGNWSTTKARKLGGRYAHRARYRPSSYSVTQCP